LTEASMKIVKSYKGNFEFIYKNYIRANEIKDIENVKAIKYLNFDNKTREIEFTFYENYKNLRAWYNSILLSKRYSSNEKHLQKAFESIGVFIAKYHKIPATSIADKIPLHDSNNYPGSNLKGFLHSDLTDNNILINNNYDIIIIDWEPTPIVDSYFNYGNILWDIVWFSNTLLKPSPGTYFDTGKRIKIVKHFLNGYEKIQKIDMNSYFSYFNENISNLNYRIYLEKNLYNKIMLKRHFKNWKSFKNDFSDI